MHNERFQNDRHFIWYFYYKDESATPFILEGKDLALEVQVGLTRIPITEYSVSGNTIDFIFRGKDQKRPAPIVATLYINKGKDDMMAIDVLAGGMTPHSDMGECIGHTGTKTTGNTVTSFIGEWIDERLIPAGIARTPDVKRIQDELTERCDRHQEAAHWSDGFIWKDDLIWRE